MFKTKLFDPNVVYQLLIKNDWKNLIDQFKDNETFQNIKADSILSHTIDQHFINELINTSSMKSDPIYKYYLQNIFLLHDSKKHDFSLNEDDFKKLVLKIVEEEKELSRAYDYAKRFPHEEICKQIIDKYQENLTKIVSHSQENTISITENKNIQNQDATVSLFKSHQEFQFYKAVREVYQMFLVIPNVALNAVIDFNSVKNKLTEEERKYFFVALVDCVVIDTHKDYKAIKFIELDSSYHDTEKQKVRDKYKDDILAKSGQKLYRIRRVTFKEDESDFIRLIRETIQ